jgi:chemotaxis protein CheX
MDAPKQKSALIIDDDSGVLEALSLMLGRLGLSTVSAQSAHEARMKIMNQKFDVIFLDLNMPKETGIQFLGSLRQSDPHFKTPVAIISGLSMEDVARSKVMSVLGVEHFFSKPLQSEEVAKWIQQRVTPSSKRSYDAAVINAFLSGTIAAVQGNTGIAPTKGAPTVKESASTLGEFSGIIQFQGKTTRGVVALSFERNCIIELATKVFQGAITEFTDKILIDFAGELCNQTAGQTQAIFQANGTRFEIGTPTLIQGNNHRIVHKFEAPCLILPFTWGPGKFFTEFILEACEAHTSEPEPPKDAGRVADSGDVSFL